MDMFSNALLGLAGDNSAQSDYIAADGFLMCGKCGTRKEVEVEVLPRGTFRKMPTACSCRAAELQREEELQRRTEFQRRVAALRRDGLSDPEYHSWTFAKDDRRQPDISETCRRYVADWPQMLADNVGLLFYGGVGTGKSFYSCCIANALLEMCVPTLVTNFPRILNKLQSAKWGDDRNDLLLQMQKYELVVIDDLGVERGTEFALEQVFAVIDARYRSGKPLIVTTNLAPADIKNPGNIAYSRVYDRILQNCLPVKMAGDSRRTEIATQKRKKYQQLLGI